MMFGVIDLARDKDGRIAGNLHRTGAEPVCLFAGKLSEPVRRRAPHLLALPAESAFARLWHEQGWNDAWGILLRSERTLEEVRRHLRQFLRVQLPDGRFALFRFYDPRILPTYLRSCTRDELALWFAAIRHFRVQADTTRRYIDFSFDGARLVER
jgi:hypothetical protein